MAFDREKAKADGWKDEEIDAYLSSKQQATPQVNAVTGQPLGQAGSTAIDEQIKADKAAEEERLNNRSTSQKFFDWVKTPEGTFTTGAALGLAAEGGRRLLKNRSKNEPSKARIDPTFDAPRDFTIDGPITNVDQPVDRMKQLQDRAEAGRQAGLGLKGTSPQVPSLPPQFGPPTVPAGDIPPVAPYSPITGQAGAAVAPQTTKTRAPRKTPEQMALQPMLTPEGKVQAFARDASGNIVWPSEMSPAGRAGAEQFMQQFPQHAKDLESKGLFGVQGMHSADTHLSNSYPPALRKEILDYVNEGKLAGHYSNYENRLQQAIKDIPAESELGKKLAQLRIDNPKGAVLGRMGTPAAATAEKLAHTAPTVSSLLKKAAIPLTIMAIADAAKAAQKGNYGEAAVRSADIATDYIPFIGQLKQGLAPQGAMAPTVSDKQFENAYKLGSPYAQTEEAKKARLKEKAGAGRGIAPPSAYMR